MDVIDHGYLIPLNDLPIDYEEENNGSARKNMEFVRKTVRELQEKGVVKFVDEKPKCVSLLTVAEQDKPGGKSSGSVWTHLAVSTLYCKHRK